MCCDNQVDEVYVHLDLIEACLKDTPKHRDVFGDIAHSVCTSFFFKTSSLYSKESLVLFLFSQVRIKLRSLLKLRLKETEKRHGLPRPSSLSSVLFVETSLSPFPRPPLCSH